MLHWHRFIGRVQVHLQDAGQEKVILPIHPPRLHQVLLRGPFRNNLLFQRPFGIEIDRPYGIITFSDNRHQLLQAVGLQNDIVVQTKNQFGRGILQNTLSAVLGPFVVAHDDVHR